MNDKYKVVYILGKEDGDAVTCKVEHAPEGKTRAALSADKRPIGACDAIIIHSIMFPPDGSRSEYIISMNGETGDSLSDIELFKSWIMLAYKLSQSKTLDTGRRNFCATVIDHIREVMMKHSGCDCEECIQHKCSDPETN